MKREWFAAKRYGYGAGLPIAWQGWAVLAGYVGLVLAGTVIVPRFCTSSEQVTLANIAMIAILSVVLIWIAANTTRGGWRWRWGDDD